MARPLFLAVFAVAVMLASSSSSSHSSSTLIISHADALQSTPSDKIKRIPSRRRNAQECHILGFISDQLECETCEQLRVPLELDGASAENKEVYSDNDIYFQCLSCCNTGRLAGDAMRLPTFNENGLERSGEEGASSSFENGDKDTPPPYVLPPPQRYWKARCEISMMNFEQSDDWSRLLQKIDVLYPITPSDIVKRLKKNKDGSLSNEVEEESEADRPISLVEIHRVYQRSSFVRLYNKGQQLPRGHPEQLSFRGDTAAMGLEVTHWDANKLAEFLNHSIAGSLFLAEEREREEEARRLKEEAEKKEKSGVSDDEL